MKSAAFASLIILLGAGSASAAQVWVAPAAQKIRPGAQVPAGATAAAKIAAAKNEFEAFQVVVTGQAGGVSMNLESLTDGAGHTYKRNEFGRVDPKSTRTKIGPDSCFAAFLRGVG